jgi:hypothetical protein
MRKLVTSWVFMILAVAVSPVLAGSELAIVDSPEPFPTGVSVKVANATSETLEGEVVVQATVDGKTVQSSATVVVDGGTTASVMVSFGSKVEGVVAVGIISDGPTPI